MISAHPARTGRRARAWRLVRGAPWSARIGLLIVGVYVALALLAPLIAPYGESEIVGSQFDLWSRAFPLGTDNIGRDMLTRLIYGIRNTIGISIGASLLAFLVGGTLGLVSAAVGGWIDHALSRIVDVLMAIPQLIFALLLLAIFGTSIPVLVAVIAAVESTRVFRLCRAVGMDVAVMEFVEVARLRGEGVAWIVRREILPNVARPLVAEFGLRFCFVFLLISGLSFLGLGIQPPTADLGSMVRDNATLITYGDITPLLPAAAIGLLVVAVNFVADWYLQRAHGHDGDA
jgi:peptide/nickel transport system permease protein